ncbi:hypothetical protein M406DRAFT_353195 [Cryphonectria parasitica EP155]|uniref:Uncharacterized protein n=1 Tax=Cryphonectria parasitica (strain ATCC 38755 / EP155) TaxID=660469 RepID=A0A9P5CLA6_CRYP1|nr:uncharacterized protein M406DRAFT_353195 [Cryphonectria parasitica EP155]KAF3761630.1 hypothetical protein M406DRAFT_353195 [Cryphonectria parasitica EP155]
MRFTQIFAVLVSIAGVSSALQQVAPRDGSSNVGLAERDEALAEILARAADLLSGSHQLDARKGKKAPAKSPDKAPAKATTSAAAAPVRPTTSVAAPPPPTTSVAAPPPPTTSVAAPPPPPTSAAPTTSVSSSAVTSIPTTSIPTTLATVTTSALPSSEVVSEPAAESTCTPNAKKGRGLFGLGKPSDGCSDGPGISLPMFPIGGGDNSTGTVFKRN